MKEAREVGWLIFFMTIIILVGVTMIKQTCASPLPNTYNHKVNDFVCVYRVNTTLLITSRSMVHSNKVYYGYTSTGRKWRVYEGMLEQGKCYEL